MEARARELAAHDAQSAVHELGKAFSLSKNPRFLLPLGLAFAEAGRPLDALDALGRFLKETPTLPVRACRDRLAAAFLAATYRLHVHPV